MASADELRAQKRAKERERETYIRRKRGVDKIIADISVKFTDEIMAVNHRIELASENLEAGITGQQRIGTVTEETRGKAEKNAESDSRLSESQNELQNESYRCGWKIDELTEEIRQLQIAIEEAERREREDEE